MLVSGFYPLSLHYHHDKHYHRAPYHTRAVLLYQRVSLCPVTANLVHLVYLVDSVSLIVHSIHVDLFFIILFMLYVYAMRDVFNATVTLNFPFGDH